MEDEIETPECDYECMNCEHAPIHFKDLTEL